MTDRLPNTWLPAPLRRLAGRALETALNHTLSLDPDTQAALVTLDGRRVLLQLSGAELAFAVSVEGQQLRVGPPDEAANLRVTATPGSLLAMALRRGDDGVAPGQVEISGDADLARRLQKLAERFAPDFEEAFARSFGDVLGVPIARAVRKALAHAKDSVSHLTEDTAAWLRDETRLALAPGEVEGFLDDVDNLREKSERLEARLARLEARLKGHGA